jgi:DNA-binding GntR family transcriptional regulator
MMLPSGPRGERSRHTFEAIRKLIVNGGMTPGQRIIETDLAERLGVSRGALRPALQQLHQEGLVVGNVPGRQTRLSVAPVTEADARELYYLAGDLEGLAAGWAAESADPERTLAVDGMRETNGEIRALFESGRLRGDRLLELDRAFHEQYISLGGGPRTRALLDSLRPQLDRYARLYTRSYQDRVTESLEEHDVIVLAIASGDPERARCAVQDNWRRGAHQLIQRIGTRGEIGPTGVES